MCRRWHRESHNELILINRSFQKHLEMSRALKSQLRNFLYKKRRTHTSSIDIIWAVFCAHYGLRSSGLEDLKACPNFRKRISNHANTSLDVLVASELNSLGKMTWDRRDPFWPPDMRQFSTLPELPQRAESWIWGELFSKKFLLPSCCVSSHSLRSPN